MQVNDILYSSWGYEQTNIDYYKVIKVTDKQVTLVEVDKKQDYNSGYMSGTSVPLPDKIIGKPFRRKIHNIYDGKEAVMIKSYEMARSLDKNELGEYIPKRFTAYA